MREQGLFVKHDGSQADPVYSGAVMELDLASVQPSLSGPKRPHDRVDMSNMKKDFTTVRHVKPMASRDDSAELFVLATGFRG